MAYKYKINPVTGKFDMVGTEEEGGVITNITSEDGTITVTSSGGIVDLAAPSLKMLEGYACGFGTTTTTGYAKFCDLYWTKVTGAVSCLPHFHINFHKVFSGYSVYYTADLCMIFGEENGKQICDVIVENETAYTDNNSISTSTLNEYKLSNIIKVDYIQAATRTSTGDPTKDSDFGHATVFVNITQPRSGNVHLHPLSSRAILYNNSNLCYFLLNPECVTGRCSTYTVQGTIQAVKTKVNTDYYTKTEIDTKIGNIETLLANI